MSVAVMLQRYLQLQLFKYPSCSNGSRERSLACADWVRFLPETFYFNFHFPEPEMTDCIDKKREAIVDESPSYCASWVINTCQDLGGQS